MSIVEEKIFVSINPGGISNRLKCLISMWRFADKENGKLLLYWPKNKTCNINFSDLFENDIEEVNKKGLLEIFKNKDFCLFDESLNVLEKTPKKYLLSESWRWKLFKDEIEKGFGKENPSKDGRDIDFEFEKIPEKLRKEFLFYLKKLKPIEKIREKITKLEEEYDLKNLVGVHLRQGDFLNYSDGMEKIANVNRVADEINKILKENPSQKFFLCTDSNEAEIKIKEIFTNKIVIFKKNCFDRLDKEFNQDGLIDLILLSKTKKIIGTYMSTFTELAWWLGGANTKMNVVATDSEKKEYLRHKMKSTGNFIGNIKKIIYDLIFPKYKRILDANAL